MSLRFCTWTLTWVELILATLPNVPVPGVLQDQFWNSHHVPSFSPLLGPVLNPFCFNVRPFSACKLDLCSALSSLRLHIFLRSPQVIRNAMEITQLYAIAVGGILLLLMLINFRPYIEAFLRAVSLPASKHLIYPQIIHRHRYFGPWSRADVIIQLVYITVNTFCVVFRVPDVSMAGLRAANLSLINMVPNFAGSHLSFLADILGVPLSTYQQIHRSSGIMSVLLLLFHVLTILGCRTPFPLQVAENLWGLIVSHSSILHSINAH